MNWTKQQEAAIQGRCKKLLVSAAAGSGKTAVLVERVFRRISDAKDPHDVTDFLIVTFTNAAAAEMRARILKRLGEALAAEPQNRHLRRQMNLIHEAQIMTVHAFCLSLIRENFHILGLRPDFRLPDEDETGLLLDEAAERLMEEEHELRSPAFLALLEAVAYEKNDGRLKELLKRAHIWLESEADAERYMAERAAEGAVPADADPGETPWGRVHLDRLALEASYHAAAYDAAEAALNRGADPQAKAVRRAAEVLAEERFLIRAVGEAAARRDWAACRNAAAAFACGERTRVLRASKELPDSVLDELRPARKEAADWKKALRGDVLLERPEDTSAELCAADGLQREFFRLVKRLGELFSALKNDANVLDFSDLEHLAVRLLAEKDEAGEFFPTPLALEKSAALAEIMVDEYQDTNGLQDLIFRMLSIRSRLFMVGDVKQSIYRFRRADPGIFLRRRERYARVDGAESAESSASGSGEDGRAVVLSDNFRSRAEVLDSVNLVFGRLMCRSFGEMEYTEEERLRFARGGAERDGRYVTELDVLDLKEPESDGGEEEPDPAEPDGSLSDMEREAAHIARRIRAMIDEGFLIDDKNGPRPCRCGDFAVLLRSMKNRAAAVGRALRAQGLAADADKSEDFFETEEIAALTALLRAVANPGGDLDLLGFMASPLAGFSWDELAQIRAANEKKGGFFDSLRACAAGDTPLAARAAAFLARLEALRAAVADMSAGEAVAYLIEETSAAAVFSAVEGGDARRHNVRRLLAMAQSYDKIGGYGDFVRYLQRLEDKKTALRQPAPAGGDSVKIMSIHASKGLEFPIVLLGGLSDKINERWRSDAVMLHPALGLGFCSRSRFAGGEMTTLRREAITELLLDEQLSEELRILYVAMTRAREKLILIARHKDAAKALKRLASGEPPVLPVYCRKNKSFAAWIEAVAVPADSAVIRVNRVACPAAAFEETAAPAPPAPDAALCAEIGERLRFVYPYAAAAALPAKLTATLYKRLLADEADAAAVAERPAPKKSFEKPRFLSEITALTAAERGTATHLAMQLLPMRAYASEAEIADGIEALRRRGQLTAAQASAIRCGELLRFYASPAGRRIAELPPGRVRREFKFSILTDAAAYFPETGAGERLLLQGVVDLYYENDDGSLAIIDFKTDAVTPADSPARARAYAPQLQIYADALAEITGRRIASKQLYFFSTGELTDV